MLRHHLRTALRTLRRNPTYTAISVVCLAVGLAGCLLVGRYVAHAFSYDDHWPKADRIVRLVANETTPEGTRHLAVAPLQWGPALEREQPAVTRAVRLEPDAGWVSYGDSTVQKGQGQDLDDGTHLRGTLVQADILYADPGILDLFDLTLQRGNPETALRSAYNILLTEDFAREHFGDANPVGTLFKLGDRIRGFEVVGVVESIPANSHFGADMIIPHPEWFYRRSDWSSIQQAYTYLELQREADRSRLQAALPSFLSRHLDPMPDRQLTADLQPISSIHLRSDRAFEMQPGGNRAVVLLFAAIAAFILILACVNFVNLATARSVDRRSEVGVRKAIGARRRDLVHQFLGEALLVSAAALGLAIAGAYAALPAFNTMAGTSLSLAGGVSLVERIVGAAFVLVALTVLAGGYPAMALSRYGPRQALAGAATGDPSGTRSWLRSGLVVFQFATAVVLVIGTAMIYQQVDFMQTRDLGYDKERIVTLPNRDHGLTNNIPSTERELSRSPAVQRVAAMGTLPGDRMPQRIVRRPDTRQSTTVSMLHTDTAFAATMELQMVAGRWLRAPWATERGLEVVLNETAVQQLGFGSPDAALGKPLHRMHPEMPDSVQARGRVVGVVKDFHWSALRTRIPPMALVPAGSKFDLEHYVARLTPGQTADGVDALTTTWKAISHYPATFRYSFLSDDWSALYRGEQRLQRIVGSFAGLAILIACLGLFGLAAYTARRRTKEIGIRKALGATATSIVGLLSKDFLTLVGVACAAALPIAFLSTQWWLSDYAYRVALSPAVFAGAVGGTVLLALLAVSQQAWRAARVDPADVLRSE